MSETSARFTEIAKAQISENKNLVFSETQQGTIVMAQQLVVKEGKKTHNIFLKGAIEVDSIDSLYELRDAVNACIRHIDGNKVDVEDDKSLAQAIRERDLADSIAEQEKKRKTCLPFDASETGIRYL